MELEVEGKPLVRNPSAEEIASALTSLNGRNSGFAILSASAKAFLQTSGDPRTGFTLEYREAAGPQYQCPDTLGVEDVIKIFQSYARNDHAWRGYCNWEILKPPQKKFQFYRPEFGEFRLTGSDIVFFIAFAVAGVAMFCGIKKWARPPICMAIFCFCFALAIAGGLISMLRTGKWRSGNRDHTRAKSPIGFWCQIISGSAMALGLIVVGILIAIGVIPFDSH